jgi:hypothetical protein
MHLQKFKADKYSILQMSKKHVALLSKFRQTTASSRTVQACNTLSASGGPTLGRQNLDNYD